MKLDRTHTKIRRKCNEKMSWAKILRATEDGEDKSSELVMRRSWYHAKIYFREATM